MKRFRIFFVVSALFAIVFAVTYCGNETGNGKEKTDTSQNPQYLNHAGTVTYVGMEACRKCHEGIYQTFIQTGMGQSFDHATIKKSAAQFGGKKSIIYDKYRDLYYQSYFRDSVMFITEYRLKGNDTIYKRTEKIDYIIGSGQHTNSHMYAVNGYVYQMPMTYYTQDGHWDLPPGFEGGFNTRFSRPIGLECMTCHNAIPQFVAGSENKYTEIPNGIGCERCHGPGSLHVQEKLTGNLVDTSKHIDYTIVNPGKLSPELQFDVCQRCHLQGNAVLKPGKSFFDFLPGQSLSDVMTVFMPVYEGTKDEFIMASHAERLKMSPCFLVTEARRSAAPDQTLRPYKNAMTCVTCHDPHVTVKQTNNEHFNSSCSGCHHTGTSKSSLIACSDTPEHLAAAQNNCVSCHMPRTGSIDIPHVTVHDHFIRKPVAKTEMTAKALHRFVGLYAVNEKNPAASIRAKAYLQQFEKFSHDPQLLDSAQKYLPAGTLQELRANFSDLVHLHFLRNDYIQVKSVVEQIGRTLVLDSILIRPSPENGDAWTAYRIGETYYHLGDPATAEIFYKKSVALAPSHPDFRNKYALALAAQQKNFEARAQFQTVLDQYPKYIPALNSLGYLWLLEKQDVKAESFYLKALALDPDDTQAQMNMAGLFLYHGQPDQAQLWVNKVLRREPKNAAAKELSRIIVNQIRIKNKQ
ncbi:MAG TPA: tetratricopeptide repeat protein [Bacteroidia bacterium]|nr:tetratricopeptide repeat protein [Bacteroidia bacterium]